MNNLSTVGRIARPANLVICYLCACLTALSVGRVGVGDELRPRLNLEGHRPCIESLAFSPDGRLLASAGTSADDCTAKIWRMDTGQLQESLSEWGRVFSVEFSPDGKSLAVTTSWDRSRAKPSGTIAIWDLAKRRRQLVYQFNAPGAITAAAGLRFSKNGKTLIGHTGDKIVVWDTVLNRVATEFSVNHMASRISCSFNMDLIAQNYYPDHCIRIWDTETGRLSRVLKGHTRAVNFVDFSPDRKTFASGDENGTVKIWYLFTGETLKTLKGPRSSANVTRYSHDGNIVAAGYNNGIAVLWDVKTYRELARFKVSQRALLAIAFSPDGQTMATAGWDKTIGIWDVPKLTAQAPKVK